MLKKIKEMFNNSVLKFKDYYIIIAKWSAVLFILTAILITPFVNAPWTMFTILIIEVGVMFGSIALDDLCDKLIEKKDGK